MTLSSYMIRFNVFDYDLHPHKFASFLKALSKNFKTKFMPNYAIVVGKGLVGVFRYEAYIDEIHRYISYWDVVNGKGTDIVFKPSSGTLILSIEGKQYIQKYINKEDDIGIKITFKYMKARLEGRVAVTIDPNDSSSLSSLDELEKLLKLCKKHGIEYSFNLLRPM